MIARINIPRLAIVREYWLKYCICLILLHDWINLPGYDLNLLGHTQLVGGWGVWATPAQTPRFSPELRNYYVF